MTEASSSMALTDDLASLSLRRALSADASSSSGSNGSSEETTRTTSFGE